jgi:site-specific DNA-methyltransferase (adenine-specific)
MAYKIITGNNTDVLRTYEDNTFDSIVTDPPYGIAFLGKDWDNDTGALETWQECFRVLKPGGHLLAFSAARTYHHLATNIEMCGFEIRDQLMWLYGSGFPKAQDIGKAIERREGKRVDAKRGTTNTHEGGMKCHKCNKVVAQGIGFKGCVSNEDDCPIEYTQRPADNEWSGWKTALKPAHEPIVMARKPFKGSTIDNVLTHGVGALNIDASRIRYADENKPKAGNRTSSFHQATGEGETSSGGDGSGGWNADAVGRFPSNVLGEVPDYQKFFYCPKVSRAERHAGFETKNIPTDPSGMYVQDENGKCLSERYEERVEKQRRKNYTQDGTLKRMKDKMHQPNVGNNHPTVKPVALMKYLVKLVTPKGGRVLDPFNGSGSTGMACVELKYDYTGIDLDKDYVEIANKRISAWEKKFDTPANNLFESEYDD